jgi:hypothetical protein
LTPGFPSPLRPKCLPSLPMRSTSSSKVGGVSGGMGVLLPTQCGACHSCLSRIAAHEVSMVWS